MVKIYPNIKISNLDTRYLQKSNNLSDITAATALTNLGFTSTITELNYTDGVTSAIQTQLDSLVVKSSNLSDLTDIATARTNLGLIASGDGDIWVEKVGDTMTGALGIGVDPDATFHVKATSGSIAKFGDGGDDARYEFKRDTGGGAELVFNAGVATMTSNGNWQLKHGGGAGDRIKFQETGASPEIFMHVGDPSIYTSGGDDLWFGRNSTEILRLNSSGVNVIGLMQVDTFRIDQAPTSETIVATHTITISCDGTNYKFPVVAA